jgi:hypothetical protein
MWRRIGKWLLRLVVKELLEELEQGKATVARTARK